MKHTVKERRKAAELEMINYLVETADKYNVCPLCLAEVFIYDMRRAEAKEYVFHVFSRHAGDEGLGGVSQ